MTWKHRDSELDRTCGKPVPIQREDIYGHVSDPSCAACDGEVYRETLEAEAARIAGLSARGLAYREGS